MLRLLATGALALLVSPALAQVGELDPSFDGDGMRVDSLDVLTNGRSVAPLPDGGVLVAGDSEEDAGNTRRGRLLDYGPDGSLRANTPYSAGGCVGSGRPTAASFYAVTSRTDGAYAFGGYQTLDCTGDYRPFHSFQVPTVGNPIRNDVTPFYGGVAFVFGLAFQPDGALVSAGFASPDFDEEGYDAAFARHLPDGSVDMAFGTDGEVTFDLANDYDFLYDVVVQPDGKIVAGGFGTTGAGARDVLLLRLLADGSLDPSFGSGGVVSLDLDGGIDDVRALALQPDGKIVAALRSADAGGDFRFGIARFLPNGALDSGFGNSGLAFVDFTGLPAYAWGVAVQADGKIVASGTTETGAGGVETRDFAIARLLTEGVLDPSFSDDGRTVAAITPGRDDAQDLAITADGHFVVVGTSRETVDGQEQRRLLLARFIGDTPPVAGEPNPESALALRVAPNPARGSVRLGYALPESGAVTLALYDILGRDITRLVDGRRPPGEHEEVLDVAGLSPGLYVLRLSTGGVTVSRPITVVR